MPLLAVCLLSLCFLVLIAFILWSSRWTQRTERMIAELSETEKLTVDMETGLRGYAIWRDRRFLEPYLEATSLQDASISRLDEQAPDAIARERVAELRTAVTDWTDWAQAMRERIDSNPTGAPIDEGLEGKRLMDRIRGVLAEMTRAEFERRDTARAWVRSIVLVTMNGSVLLTVLVGAFLLLRWRRTLRDTAATYTQTIRLSRKQGKELEEAYRRLDREIKAVADIQRSLLPRELPDIPGLSIAAHYETSTRVGGDYYDFFNLGMIPDEIDAAPPDDGRWGILIADVSGHGTPAAVVMAVTHTIAHGYEHPPTPPSHLLEFVNRRLCQSYTGPGVSFVTAFYGIYSPAERRLEYAGAGHNPPRLRRAATGGIEELADVNGLPLGIDEGEIYSSASLILDPGDLLVLYTDGITEARNDDRAFFDVKGLDDVMERCTRDGVCAPEALVDQILSAVDFHAGGREADDDRTLIAIRVN